MYPWSNIFTPKLPPRATSDDFLTAARLIGCTPAEIKAVWKVEAAGRPFRGDGSVERRFEPHKFPSRHWDRIGFHVRKGEAPWRASVRMSNDRMFLAAYEIDPEAALLASSWGAPQIMGFNHQDAGHASARSMVSAMATGEASHLRAFTSLVTAWGLSTAIRARDWETFARRYNGPGQVPTYAARLRAAMGVTETDTHAAKLAASVRKETGRESKIVLRRGSTGKAVRLLQRNLGIKEDGLFGVATEAAVREYQKKHKLLADGIVGARTWAALEKGAVDLREVEAQPETAVPHAPAVKEVAVIGMLTSAVAAGVSLPGLLALGAVIVVAALIWRGMRK